MQGSVQVMQGVQVRGFVETPPAKSRPKILGRTSKRVAVAQRIEKNRKMTWGRKTGGRKKGTPNKIKKPLALMAEAQAEVAAAVSGRSTTCSR